MSTQAEIQVTYDLPADFFRPWLGERMVYSCGLWEEGDDLAAAQVRKLAWIADAAHVEPGKRVLDVGCGWGGCLQYLARERGVRDAVGITLSPGQFAESLGHGIEGVTVELADYREWRPSAPFDAVVSIGMFEHIATPEEARAGRHLDIYREYFRKIREWTSPGAWFGLQSVIGLRVPRDRKDLAELGWGTYTIFPGAISPRLEAIVQAAQGGWEVMEVRTRREHYARTAAAWRDGLRRHEREIRARFGDARFDEYDRYLDGCVRMFERQYQSLAQLSLRRID